MKSVENITDTTLLSIGSVYSLANIEHMLGILILIIQLVWIVTKLTVKIVISIKNKVSLDKLDDDVSSAIDFIDSLDGDFSKEDNEDCQN